MQAVAQGLLSSVGRIAGRPARQIRWSTAVSAAEECIARRRLTAADRHLREAVEIARGEWPDGLRLADSLVRYADLCAALDRPQNAMRAYSEAVLLLGDRPDGIGIVLAQAVSNLARLMLLQDERAKARELMESAMALQRRIKAPDTPTLHFNRALVAAQSGRDKEAQAAFDAAVAALGSTPGTNEMLAIAIHDNYAWYCVSRGRRDEAEMLLRNCLIIRQEAAGPRHPIYALGLNNLARLQLGAANRDEVEALLLQAADICERNGPQPASGLLSALYYLARLAFDEGRPDEVEKLRERIIEFGAADGKFEVAAEGALMHVQSLLQRDFEGEEGPEPLLRRAAACAQSLKEPFLRLGREMTNDVLVDLTAILRAKGRSAEAGRIAARAEQIAHEPLWSLSRQLIPSI